MVPEGFELHPVPDGGFGHLLGPLYSRRIGNSLRFGFVCREIHTNAMNSVHGGLLMTFADQVLGLSVQDALKSDRVATVSLNCDFVSGVRAGQWIEGEARITRVTQSLVFVDGTISRGRYTVLTASGLWYRRLAHGTADDEGASTR
jgi:uncharacterized protein (TIGR00369 family)